MAPTVFDELVLSEQDAARIVLSGKGLVCEGPGPAIISFELRIRSSPLLLPGVGMWVDDAGGVRFVELLGHGPS